MRYQQIVVGSAGERFARLIASSGQAVAMKAISTNPRLDYVPTVLVIDAAGVVIGVETGRLGDRRQRRLLDSVQR